MANTEVGEGTSFDIQSVSRVGQILGLYGPQTTELTAAEVADRLGLNRTTAYRYCASLVAAGILDRGRRRGSFVLGGLMLQLGIQALGRRRVVDLAPPYLRELSSAVGLTAVLSLWGAGVPVVALVQEDAARAVMVTVRPGTRLDTSSAQIRVFLAHLTDHQVVESVLASLPPAERAEMEAAIYTVRRSGSCFATLPDGFYSVAAPVFDDDGIAATIAVLGADQLADPASRAAVIARVADTAAALSDQLGSGATTTDSR
ncbi:IclR family transcriptional regulator [Agromyces bauzanensis]